MLTMKSEFHLLELLLLTTMHWVSGEKVFRGVEGRDKNSLLHGNTSRKAIDFVSLLLFLNTVFLIDQKRIFVRKYVCE